MDESLRGQRQDVSQLRRLLKQFAFVAAVASAKPAAAHRFLQLLLVPANLLR
jgi:hypothetical protein